MTHQKQHMFLALLFILALNSNGLAQEKAQAGATPVEELVARLEGAKTDEERKVLLASEKMVNAETQRALIKQGASLISQGSAEQALKVLRLAQMVAEQLGDKPGLAEALFLTGGAHIRQKTFSEALDNIQRSMTLYEALGNKEGMAKSLERIGYTLRAQLKCKEAIAYAERSLALYEEIGNKAGASSALSQMGGCYIDQRQYAQALESFQRGLKLEEELGNKVRISAMLSMLGRTHRFQGNHALGLEYLQKALTLAENIKDNYAAVVALLNIASLYESKRENEPRIEYLLKALTPGEALPDKRWYGETLEGLGNAYRDQGHYDLALEYFNKLLALGEKTGSKFWEATALLKIETIYYRQGRYDLALEALQKGLALSEAIKDKQGIARAYRQLGVLYLIQGNDRLAQEYDHKVLAMVEESGDKSAIASALNNIGVNYKVQGDYQKALEFYQRSLRASEGLENTSTLGNLLTNMARIYRLQGDIAKALEYSQKSLAVRETLLDKGDLASTLSELAIIHRTNGNYTEALKMAERSVAILKQRGDLRYIWTALTILGDVHFAQKQTAQARQAYDEAIARIETARLQVAGGEDERQRFFENKLTPYHQMIRLLVEQNNATEAIAYAERAKARVLLDVLQGGRVNIAKSMTLQERERERQLREGLAALNIQISDENRRKKPDESRLTTLKANLEKARLDYEAFQMGLYSAHPELKVRRGEAQIIKLNEFDALLPDARSALLEYVVTDEKTYLFVFTKSGKAGQPVDVQSYALDIKGKEMVERVNSFRQQLARREANFTEAARQLYGLLLGASEKALAGKTTLVIVPDGALWELPFQALQTVENRYLVEDRVVSYAPSLTVLREMAKARNKDAGDSKVAPTLLAFGNPSLGKQAVERTKSVLMDEKLDPLPEAEKLVNALPQLYGARQSKVYTGTEAREDRAKTEAAGFRVLQFATHGVLNDKNPMYSYVLLSQTGSTKEDGLLEAWEMMSLNLRADLVVLSACETARGRVGAGEGMIGMTWALFVAGSPATVVSQWKVESSSTTALMLEFHRHLKAKFQTGNKISTAAALREAELKLLRDEAYRHPFYWAGFVLVGDGR
jgi:CHAT domain-containing protein